MITRTIHGKNTSVAGRLAPVLEELVESGRKIDVDEHRHTDTCSTQTLELAILTLAGEQWWTSRIFQRLIVYLSLFLSPCL